jgi:hypothetical protein
VSGRAAFRRLDARSRDEIGRMLEQIPATGRRQLLDAMTAIERVLVNRG